jgi:RecA-family ATPase
MMASTQQATTIESPENFLVSELILKPPRQPDWIFPDLWQAMTPGLFTGDGGLGKTHFALQMALAIATGGKIDGTPIGCASPRSVVYISQEDEAEHLYAALLSQWPDLKDNHDVTDRIRIISTAVQGHPLFLSELNHQRDLIQNISQGAVFFLDSFSNFITSNENDNSQILKSEFAGLRTIMRICKATPMLIHHRPKQNATTGTKAASRGAVAIQQSCRFHIMFDKQLDGVELSFEKVSRGNSQTSVMLSFDPARRLFVPWKPHDDFVDVFQPGETLSLTEVMQRMKVDPNNDSERKRVSDALNYRSKPGERLTKVSPGTKTQAARWTLSAS